MNLPQSAYRFCRDIPTFGLSAGDRAVSLNNVEFTPGDVITVGFMDGTITQKNDFKLGLEIWGQYVNLNFQIVNNYQNAIVRVKHIPNQSWSEVGLNCLNVPVSQPTLSIGWTGLDVILHEIGHMIGLLHEHQNPSSSINWNVQVLNEVLAGPPNFWTPRMIEQNIIERYNTNQVTGTEFDPNSIMLYPVDPTWTVDGFSTAWNQTLSATDIAYAQRLYPFPNSVGVTTPVVKTLEDNSTLITNMTDDPNNPVLINPPIEGAKFSAGGMILGAFATAVVAGQVYKYFRNEN